jgi:hypothetical protein
VDGQIQYGAGEPLTSQATRLGRFRHELRLLGSHPSRRDLDRLLARARALDLPDEEIREELTEIHAAMEAADLADQIVRHGVPEVLPLEPLPANQRCHFLAPVRCGRRGADRIGHLELTSDWLKFCGPSDVNVTWTEIAGIERVGREIVVSLVNSRRLLRFACQTLNEAARGAVIARYLAARVAT